MHARSDVNSIIDPNDNATVNKIRTELLDGDALLDADPDYIQNEKDSIADTVLADTTKLVSDRISALQTVALPGSHHIIILGIPRIRDNTDLATNRANGATF